MATAMSANVLVWIIPGQRKMVAAMQAGLPMDPKPGKIGKQRSVHNTYFTLPVIVAMLSNHYGFVTQHEHRFLLLLLLMAAGAAIRVYFVQRHAHRHGRAGNPSWIGLLGLGLILAAIVTAAPRGQPSGQVGPNNASGKVPQPILALAEKHCLSCHGSAVQMKGLRLDSAEAWLQNAANIHQQVVIAKAMPMGNGTGMTDQERVIVKDWFNSLQQAK
jgi:uncharacterized membrane protein